MGTHRSIKRAKSHSKARIPGKAFAFSKKSILKAAKGLKQAMKGGGFIGIDPDLHATGIAFVGLEGAYKVRVARAPDTFRGHHASCKMVNQILTEVALLRQGIPEGTPLTCVVELPEIYSNHRARSTHVNPQDIVNLAIVSGGALAGLQCFMMGGVVLGVQAKSWTGGIDKGVRQLKMLQVLNWQGEPRYEGKVSKITGERCPGYWVPNKCDVAGLDGADALKNKDWKHVLDAICLAAWGMQKAYEGMLLT